MDPTGPRSLLRSFERQLRAENLSPRTISNYQESLGQAQAFLAQRGRGFADADRGDLQDFLADLLTRRSAATAAIRYKHLKRLYRWLTEEGEIPADPMARMKPPLVPEQPVPVVPEDGLRRLLAACEGRSFEARRDTAMILFLIDTGARRGEIIDLRLTDLDFDLDVALVLGKGRRERTLPFGRTTAVALDRYLRLRSRHRFADRPWLWPGEKGRLTKWGLVMMLRRRGDQAGLPGLPARLTGASPPPTDSDKGFPRSNVSCQDESADPACWPRQG